MKALSQKEIAQLQSLRIEDHKSIKEIAKITGKSVGTVAKYLGGTSLPPEELARRASLSAIKSGQTRKYEPTLRDDPIGVSLQGFGSHYSSTEKGAIAEAIVVLRLLTWRFSVFRSTAEGDKVDLLAYHRQFPQRLVKIQVKWASRGKAGKPASKLHCSDGRKSSRSYTADEVDFFVLVDGQSGDCYVYKASEVSNTSTLSCKKENHERWGSVQLFAQEPWMREMDELLASLP